MEQNGVDHVNRHIQSLSSLLSGNEFCERFSYYGMRTILVLYLTNILKFEENMATLFYHAFMMACFFTPILGAIIADSFLGKFMTILIISIVYAFGNIILSLGSFLESSPTSFIGLALIALGTGGIKPCVSSFGGDQFAPEQKNELKQFFSMFYLSINAGSLISTYLTPVLRQDVKCFSRNDCYPLAFGVPAILMILAVGLFILGRFVTKYIMVPPQKENILVKVCSCITYSLRRKICSKGHAKDHWLDYADDKFDMKTISDVKVLLRVLLLYLPLPIFWALYDQQGSRWTLQAVRMNGQLGNLIIKPDQIQVVNPLLIIVMIPIFEYLIYPLLEKVKFNRPLQRMVVGGILAGLSFIICALMQLQIEQEQPVQMINGHNHVVVINGLSHCNIKGFNSPIAPYKAEVIPNINRHFLNNFDHTFITKGKNGSSKCREESLRIQTSFNVEDSQSLVLFMTDQIYLKKINSFTYDNVLVKPKQGGAQILTVFNLNNYNDEPFEVSSTNDILNQTVLSTTDNESIGYLNNFEVEISRSDVIMSVGNGTDRKSQNLILNQGAGYIQVIHGDMNGIVHFDITNIVEKNKMSVFLQIIQYVVITCAEIMFSITGLEFSYSQAPKSMKSVLQACWLLTMAFGNLIIVIIADLPIFAKQSHEFFFFGGLMIVDIAIFSIVAYFYVPNEVNDDEDQDKSN
ncbi:hypothetical protein BLOT_012066 [Blomia tropicalis]|nr:hypothetical protein BLOT_012066 [Blomia tropicalis]